MRKFSLRRRLVNLGCGKTWHPDWDNYDINPAHPSIKKLNLLEDWRIPHKSYEAVYCSHVLEHLPRSHAFEFLTKCKNILKTGGTVRLVVPDLENICRVYLEQVEAVRNGIPGSHERHRWMQIELIDQMVRTQSGGIMGLLWQHPTLIEKDFIISRLGEEAEYWIEKLASIKNQEHKVPQDIFKIPEKTIEEEVEFRKTGENHLWMYDEISLTQLLREVGFAHTERRNHKESRISGFNNYFLDTNHQGYPRKPHSLYVEAWD